MTKTKTGVSLAIDGVGIGALGQLYIHATVKNTDGSWSEDDYPTDPDEWADLHFYPIDEMSYPELYCFVAEIINQNI